MSKTIEKTYRFEIYSQKGKQKWRINIKYLKHQKKKEKK